ncbi:hypothetical protein BSKO_08991 [Bryopsis sp. KO-2023]|nr:hypothetical protein BSKO_08991 [Bryopsis sp. KO-2023]
MMDFAAAIFRSSLGNGAMGSNQSPAERHTQWNPVIIALDSWNILHGENLLSDLMFLFPLILNSSFDCVFFLTLSVIVSPRKNDLDRHGASTKRLDGTALERPVPRRLPSSLRK